MERNLKRRDVYKIYTFIYTPAVLVHYLDACLIQLGFHCAKIKLGRNLNQPQTL